MSEPVRLYLTKWALERFGPIQGVIVLDVTDDQIVAWRERAHYPGGLSVPREALEPWQGKSILLYEQLVNDQWFTEEGAARSAVKRQVEISARHAKVELERAEEQLADFRRQGVRYAETKAVRDARRKQERAATRAKKAVH